MKILKLVIFSFLAICMVLVVFTFFVNLSITNTGDKYCFSSMDSIPHNHCGVVLGTSKYQTNGKKNLYYSNRIKAAVELYNRNKIDYIIVSGDNRNRNYNEPITMYNDLVLAGIPGAKIILDYAGFRTLDSVVRGKEVFGQNKFTIISQSFHNQRATYIAHKKGIEAIAFNAEGLSENDDFKLQVREIAARVLVIFDMLTAKQPHFLGEKIVVPGE